MITDNSHINYPHPSRRTSCFARKGMVAASQPQAAQAGLEMLKAGGNAVDAAIASAAALTVVEPTGCGIGGDAFAIVWMNGKMHGLNASGPAPAGLTPESVRAAGHNEMPAYGWTPVTVPGCPASWAALSERFGKLPFKQLLSPAIALAREGFPVSPTISFLWDRNICKLKQSLDSEVLAPLMEDFTVDGRAPKAGELFKNEAQARTLEAIADSNAGDFYRGELAHKIDQASRQNGGYIRAQDLADYQPEWVKLISVNYRGYDVWEIPPNGQGIVALMALKILDGFDFSGQDALTNYHRQIEAMKLAFIDGKHYVTDREAMGVTVEALLSSEYASERRAMIGEQALHPQAGKPQAAGTVYLATADADGNMVSFIQSNYEGLGSGVAVPDTGVTLQNRGHTFSLDASHANVLQPGKRTFHTIIPGFLTHNGTALGPFGVMGGFMQPQGHVQVLMNMIDYGLNPQAALDAPRWQWMGDKSISVEHGLPLSISQGLAMKGHDIAVAHDSTTFGRGQIIMRDPNTGVLSGGTEARTDGYIAVW